MHPRLAVAATLAIVLAGLPSIAIAQATTQLRLSWDHCAAEGYVADRAFACDSNTGEEVLFASVVFGDDVPWDWLGGFESFLDITTTASTLPPWWELGSGLYCRTNGVLAGLDSLAVSSACVPWYWADGDLSRLALSVLTFEYGYDGPGSVRAHFMAAVPAGAEVSIPAGQHEYTFARFRLKHSKATGAGSCAGCLVPACMGFGLVKLVYTPPMASYVALGTPASTVTWQGAYVSSYEPTPPWMDYAFHPYRGNLRCATGPVPAQGRTWGMIKTMYR